jgi:hypothetical protein
MHTDISGALTESSRNPMKQPDRCRDTVECVSACTRTLVTLRDYSG